MLLHFSESIARELVNHNERSWNLERSKLFTAAGFKPRRIDRALGDDVRDRHLATHAVRAGLVDEYHLFLTPIILGGGKPSLPRGVRVKLELLNERRFENGMVYLHYRVGS